MRELLCTVLGAILTSCSAAPAMADPVRIEAATAELLAQGIQEKMLSLPSGLEYAAFMSCDTSGCWSSDLAYGDAVSVSGLENMRIYPSDDTDLIVGYIHVHPKQTGGGKNADYLINALNISPSLQDYFAVKGWANDGEVYQPVSLWIIGPDNALREYPLPQPK